jgi:hypothetical protein
VELQQLSIPDQVANRHGLEVEGLRLAAALGLVPILLKLDKLGQAGDQSSDFLSLIVGQPLVRDGDGVRRLALHMSQRHGRGKRRCGIERA